MADRLEEMVKMQQAFQKRIGLFTGEPKKLEKDTKELVLSIHEKASDVLRGVDWKLHRNENKGIEKFNLQDQITDLMKFVFILASEWGMNDEEIYEWFVKKSRLVEKRYDREFSDELSNSNCAVVDIDGVLCDYRKTWHDFLISRGVGVVNNISVDLSGALSDPSQYRFLKEDFRREGWKTKMNAFENASIFTETLSSFGLKVVIVTARPMHEHMRIYYDTVDWLEKNGIFYDHLVFEEKKREWASANLNKIRFCVEDDPLQAQKMSTWGMKVFLVDQPYNKNVDNENIIRVENLLEIVDQEFNK